MIAVTGIGVISAIGDNSAECLDALIHSRSGIGEVKYLDTSRREFKAGEIKHDDEELRRMSGLSADLPPLRTVMPAIIAAREALSMAGLDKEALAAADFVNGTTVGGMDYTETLYPSEECLRYNSCGTITSIIASHIGAGGHTATLSTACSSGANAIAYAADSLRFGECEVAIAGGTESLSRFHFNGFNSLMIMSREVCRPFSADRCGINLGEGAAYLVLETLDHALARGAKPLALLCGEGNACDAFHPTATSDDGLGPKLSMLRAFEDTAARIPGFKASDISYISTHGTGTPNNDLTELRAMREVFGNDIPPFSSTKSLTAHPTSASAALQAVFAVLSFQHDFLPGQGFEGEPIEDFPSPLSKTVKAHPEYILCNSFGFGGNETTLIFRRYDGN